MVHKVKVAFQPFEIDMNQLCWNFVKMLSFLYPRSLGKHIVYEKIIR